MREKIPCTVGILTYNNENTIKRALESVKDFEEIIICDGGSTDKTLMIADSYGARVLKQDDIYKDETGKLFDYSGPRNQMLEAATLEWFAFLDSDEEFTIELVDEIYNVIKSNSDISVYRLHRKFVYEKEVVTCSVGYPNFQVRLFRKDAVKNFIKPIHERIDYNSEQKVGDLKSNLLVPLEMSAIELQEKWRHYLKIQISCSSKSRFRRVYVSLFNIIKYSLVYSVRLVSCRLFVRGKKLPLSLEWVWFWQHYESLRINLLSK